MSIAHVIAMLRTCALDAVVESLSISWSAIDSAEPSSTQVTQPLHDLLGGRGLPVASRRRRPVENMSTQRAHPVENLCAKIYFVAEYAWFLVEIVLHAFFVIHFA